MFKRGLVLFSFLLGAISPFQLSAQGDWFQIGSDIDGEVAQDRSGSAIDISADGNYVIIGAELNDAAAVDAGHARVFENSAGTWVQLGGDIDGIGVDDRFGSSVSISDDGTTVAVGAKNNDDTGLNAGEVRVFQLSAGVWTQIGGDINGEAAADLFGISVDLNEDGTVLVAGGERNDGSGIDAGHARVYEFSGGVWTQIGADIDGELAYDWSGSSVSINNAGDRVAIGARRNDGGGSSSGHVRVFENSGGVWIQVGADIDGEAVDDWSGSSVSLNAAGDIVAIGAPNNDGGGADAGHARVYQEAGGVWTQIGIDMDGGAADEGLGNAIGINDAGNRIAIGGAKGDDGGAESGLVTVYKNLGGTWVQLGTNILGEALYDRFGWSTAINGAGNIVGGGAYVNDGAGTSSGHVKVYELICDTLDTTAIAMTEYCLGDPVTLDAVSINGGTITWDGGVTNGVPFTPPAVGSYSYNAFSSDINDCDFEIEITVIDLPVVTAAVDDDEVCDGETVVFTGGGADTYTWDGGVTDGVAFAPPVGVTTYTVTGTDAVTTCSNTSTIDVTVNALPIVTASVDDPDICLGESAVFTGGGTDSYSWDLGVTDGVAFTPAASGTVTYTVTGTDATTGCENTATVDLTVFDLPVVTATATPIEICLGDDIIFTGGGADAYIWDLGVIDGVAFVPATAGTFTHTVTGTDLNGCVNTATVDVTINDLPTVTASVDDADICDGETVVFTGGGADTYGWDGGVVDGDPFSPPIGTTTYTVTGTNESTGCENTASVDVTVYALPTVTALVDDPDICLGESAIFSGGGTDTYLWDLGVVDGVPYTPLASGTNTYTVTGTNTATGCENTATVDLTVFDLPVVTATSSPTEICLGESIILTGGGAVTYAWDMGVTDGLAFAPSPAGTYTYTVSGTDANGCQNTESIEVNVYSIPVVTATAVPDVICFGENITFFGGGADTYVWDGGVTDGVPFTPIAPGVFTYSVIGTVGATSCFDTATVDITVLNLPAVIATAIPSEVCLGNDVTLSGFGADLYTWDGGVTDGMPFTPIAPGTFEYVLTGTDLTTGCENTDTIEIIVNENPIVDATATPDELCLGETAIIGGSGADVYVWDGGIADGDSFTPTDIGSYTFNVIGTDLTTNCSAEDSVTITVYPLPEVSAFVTDSIICLGESVVFSASGGVGYDWEPDIEMDTPYSPTDIGLQVYTVTGYSAEGCENTASVEVTVIPLPFIEAGTDTVINTGGLADIFMTTDETGSYVWEPNYQIDCATCAITQVSPVENTTYIAYFTNEQGCTSSDSVRVWVNYVEGVGVADIFSPNGDGQNDELLVQGYHIVEIEFKVYNKYGELVFQSNDQEFGWDGTFRNRPENAGVFTWVLFYNLDDGTIGDMQGTTTLIR